MKNMTTQLAVLGAGPGGYTAAFYAADLGMEVAIIDVAPGLGGVCLNRGCIPSKVFLHVAKTVFLAEEINDFGVSFSGKKIDIDKLREKKNSVVDGLTSGLEVLRKKRGIEFIQGNARFVTERVMKITSEDGEETELAFDQLIIASGSRPATIPSMIESPHIWDSTGALEMNALPGTMLVIGGGYIGIELGQVYAALGSEVTLVEMGPGILPGSDRDLVKFLDSKLHHHFKEMMFNSKVIDMRETGSGIEVEIATPDGHKTNRFSKVLVAVGRKPNVEDLELHKIGIELDDHGFIKIDKQRRTTVPNIFAIGDVAGQPMLAHKAAYEAKVAVEAASGKKTEFDPKAIPAVIFTDPEIAWCGLTEGQAEAQNLDVKIASFPWQASGRAATQGRKTV